MTVRIGSPSALTLPPGRCPRRTGRGPPRGRRPRRRLPVDQDRLAVGEGELRAIVVHPVQGERLHQHDPAQRLDNLLPEGLAPQLRQKADQGRLLRRAYSIITPRNSGACTVSASRNQSHSPRAWTAASMQDVGLARPAGGQMVVRQDAHPRVSAGEVSAICRVRSMLRSSITRISRPRICLVGRPMPGNRPASIPRPWPG